MTKISVTINELRHEAEVEPRLHLADFMREKLDLTGTHIGCEHGVCGACTVLIDGVPVRSCITYAVACDGADITTIEGLEDDPIADQLRTAFSKEHALQCGYCTPGMLISARDIVTRLPHADEHQIRQELSGNLCRCTGYVGIVNAVKCVLKAQTRSGETKRTRKSLGPAGAHAPKHKPAQASERLPKPAPAQAPGIVAGDTLKDEDWAVVEAEGVELLQTFDVAHSRADVWRFFANLDQVALCIPGARLTSQPARGPAEGEINIKLGPITAAFAGLVEVERDDRQYLGLVRGAGRDTKSASRARGIIKYQITARESDGSTVEVSVKFLLAGALAQFSRSGLVKDVAGQLTRTFAANLEARLSGKEVESETGVLDASAIARAAVWARITGFFRQLFGRE